jgi:hypothetical protein
VIPTQICGPGRPRTRRTEAPKNLRPIRSQSVQGDHTTQGVMKSTHPRQERPRCGLVGHRVIAAERNCYILGLLTIVGYGSRGAFARRSGARPERSIRGAVAGLIHTVLLGVRGESVLKIEGPLRLRLRTTTLLLSGEWS